MIEVTFHNFNTLSTIHWTVKDEETDSIIIDKEFAPNESVKALLHTGGRYGSVYYKHPGISFWNHKQNIESGETVDLW